MLLTAFDFLKVKSSADLLSVWTYLKTNIFHFIRPNALWTHFGCSRPDFKCYLPLPAFASKDKNLKATSFYYWEDCLGTGGEFNSYSGASYITRNTSCAVCCYQKAVSVVECQNLIKLWGRREWCTISHSCTIICRAFYVSYNSPECASRI